MLYLCLTGLGRMIATSFLWQSQYRRRKDRSSMMKRTLHLLIFAALVTTIVACRKEPSTTNADSKALPASAPASAPAAAPANAPATVRADIVDKVQPAPKVTIPAGTKLRV